MLTIDALLTVRKIAHLIVKAHGADYMMTVKENAPETHAALSTIAWDEEATGTWQEDIDLAHGRMEKRCIDVMTPLEGMLNYPYVKQIFRSKRLRPNMKTGDESTTVCFGMTSVSHKEASPQQLLQWNRGHWGVENLVHRTRDDLFKEDAGLARVGHASAFDNAPPMVPCRPRAGWPCPNQPGAVQHPCACGDYCGWPFGIHQGNTPL